MTAKLLSLTKVSALLARSKPTLRKWIEEGTFPQGKPDPNGVLCWSENVVMAWQTLYEPGFFEKPVKGSLSENRRQRLETAGKSDGPKPTG